MTDTIRADVLILGGGPVGATLALALDAHGLTGVVVDPADPEAQLAPAFDGRASAIASASHRMFDAIGLSARLEGQGCAISAIRVSDGLRPGRIDFAAADGDPLGIMYENRALRRALHAAVGEAGGVTRLRGTAVPEPGPHGVSARLADGRTVLAPVAVAADGRRSPTREAAGIPVARWRYRHSAVIGGFAHERPHDGTAYEIFYPSGPFALLPLADDAGDEGEGRHRSAIVWTVDERDADGMAKLGDRAFLAEAERRMGGFLGKLSDASPRQVYPLGFHHAARVTGDRLALVGDAAHGIHPIAGQGLNLGLRDVAALTEVLVEGARLGLDLGAPAVLERYQRWRALDSFAIAAATDGLARLFGVPGAAAGAVRRLGLSAVNAVPTLKDLFMAEARGEAGALPRLLTGAPV